MEKTFTKKKNIDVLKFVSLFCIILAHVNPPQTIFQLRNFDVVLMIMISIYLFFYSNKQYDWLGYLKKRFMRLIIPTWIFLTFFFLICFLFNIFKFDFNIIISSFTLNEGIGYVWIVRIYFLLSLVLVLYRNIFLNYSFIKVTFITSMLYVIYEYLCFLGVFKNGILLYFFAYIIPLLLIIVVTFWIMRADSKKVFLFSIFNLIIFILLLFIIYRCTGEIKNTNYYKYPFQIYYLSYGFFVSSLLIIFFRESKITDFFYNSYISFVSRNSLYFYLWHVLVIYIFKNITIIWLWKYILVIILTSIIMLIQEKIVNYLETKKVSKNIISLLRG